MKIDVKLLELLFGLIRISLIQSRKIEICLKKELFKNIITWQLSLYKSVKMIYIVEAYLDYRV